MHKIVVSAATIFALSSPAFAAGELSTYPVNWDTTQAGVYLPGGVVTGRVFDDEFKTLSVGADKATNVTWYAPIHAKLGVGTMAEATDHAAIMLAGGGMELKTRNPDAANGVDVNVQTMDNHGHGFSITNGYIEVAVMPPTAHGSHAGIWLLSQQGPQGHGEIDIAETYGAQDGQGLHQAVHWWPTAASRFSKAVYVSHYTKEPTLQTAWHKLGVRLTPSSIIMYYDLKETARIARLPEQQVPFYVLLSNFTDANRTDGYQPSTMRVAYVRAWGK